ncbi:agmatine deiminase family protein [Winogradskyella aurantia]|uniref:Agmatine deiminase n=1 Tax=Winogradskyella aurantia TaxID=1915063 RepID=A0A265UYF3_9FLAO|nr:agmatine deiminase family protein [Winogradskyella aurantia]OZV70097.1 hypothetical protein CA834_05620 [Winogradskyella aurantia]
MRILFLVLIIVSLIGCKNKSVQKFRIPAEWEEHEAIWLSWDDYRQDNNRVIANIINQLHGNVKVKVAFPSDSTRKASFQILDSLNVDTLSFEAHIYPEANSWIRDYGAVFALDGTNHLAMVDFGWNQYGRVDWSYARWPEWFGDKYDSIKTAVEKSDRARIDSLMGITTQAKHNKIDVFLEGGSFEYNGNGVLIQSEAVTLQRNPDKTKEELEKEFSRFGIKKVIWLPQGVIEDEHFEMLIDNKYMVGGTGGHTDEFVRFTDENTILLAWVDEDEIDEHPLNQLNYDRMSINYEILKNATDINGKSFNIIKMPIPRPVETPISIIEQSDRSNKMNNKFDIGDLPEGHALSVGDTIQGIAAAGYLNFLVTNGLVLTATYGEYGSMDKDEEAKTIFQKVFPNRKIVMIDVLPLNSVYGGGGIHCVTMQEPKIY